MGKLKFVEVKLLAQGYLASEWQNRDSDEMCLMPKVSTPKCLTDSSEGKTGPKSEILLQACLYWGRLNSRARGGQSWDGGKRAASLRAEPVPEAHLASLRTS